MNYVWNKFSSHTWHGLLLIEKKILPYYRAVMSFPHSKRLQVQIYTLHLISTGFLGYMSDTK